MQHADHVALLRDGVMPGVWADLGSCDGALTLALAAFFSERPAGSTPSIGTVVMRYANSKGFFTHASRR